MSGNIKQGSFPGKPFLTENRGPDTIETNSVQEVDFWSKSSVERRIMMEDEGFYPPIMEMVCGERKDCGEKRKNRDRDGKARENPDP